MIIRNLERKWLISFLFLSPSSKDWGHELGHEFKQGTKLEPTAYAEAMEEWCLLHYSLWLAHPVSTQHPRPWAQGWYHPLWAGDTYIKHRWRKCTTGQTNGDLSSAEVPFSKRTLACTKFTWNQPTHMGVFVDKWMKYICYWMCRIYCDPSQLTFWMLTLIVS